MTLVRVPISLGGCLRFGLGLLCVPPVMLFAMPAAADTQFTFALDVPYTTSAAVYTPADTLVRTLWRATALDAGAHARSWDNTDDHGVAVPAGNYKIKLLRHHIGYTWEGVIGNSSGTFTGPQVHRAFLPVSSLAIAGDQAYYAVGYNESQVGFHGFNTANPQLDVKPLNQVDPFTGWAMVATDGSRIYWANTGGLARNSFIAVSDAATGQFTAFSAGNTICLNYRGNTGVCYESQFYGSVIDQNTDAAFVPTGLAVQAAGSVLAVAHGGDVQANGHSLVKLFDKTSGQPLATLEVPLAARGVNQLGMAPNGDLWVVSGTSVLRYSQLDSTPTLAATISGLSRPLAVAVHPFNNDLVLVADGGASQQVKAYDRFGNALWTYGKPGGYGSNPAVKSDKLWFRFTPTQEQTALAIQPDGSFWVADTANNRVLHISAERTYLNQLAYIPHSYLATVDANRPQKVFANFLEFSVDHTQPLGPGMGSSWKLVRNWLAGYPNQGAAAANTGFAGLITVNTLSNGRTYAISSLDNGSRQMVELMATGAARDTGIRLPDNHVFYENGELGYSSTDTTVGVQSVWRRARIGFDVAGNPQWAAPQIVASVPTLEGSPHYRGAYSGTTAARFPVTSSNKVVFFDQTVNSGVGGNEGFHLGAAGLSQNQWLWQASPTGAIDGLGSFQTKAVDGTINYGGNAVWAKGRHVVYGFHGEFFTDPLNGRVGQANQFMHFYDDGLFVGQFGLPTTRALQDADVGQAGNAFSNILVTSGSSLYIFHNDESSHGGVHRWRVDNWRSPSQLTGFGTLNSSITLR